MIGNITLAEAKDKIKNNKNVLLIFSTDWCGECKMNTLIWEKVLPEYEKTLVYFKIDVDKQKLWIENENPDFKINTVPTIIGYQNGKIIFTQKNFLPEAKLRALLEQF
ncbi:MAG: thioredoxin fold domain-containing protein [Mycoplasmataceae bacterium]|nr:thioredoxin fold domain-containing protein [Mycoplasmataceae bacterium]